MAIRILELGHVVLYVSNLNRSADFYRDILGFHEIVRGPGVAAFSSGRTHHELLLIEVGPLRSREGEARGEPVRERTPKPGLYHIGFKIGDSPEDAKRVFRELKKRQVPIVGTGDHGVTHSIYILDPDGNELELYADVSDEWKRDPGAAMIPVQPLIFE